MRNEDAATPRSGSANKVLTSTVIVVALALALIVLGTNSMGLITAEPRFEIGRIEPPEPIGEQVRSSNPATAAPAPNEVAAEDSIVPLVVMVAAGLIVLASIAAVAHTAVRTRYSARDEPVEDEDPDGQVFARVVEEDLAEFRQHFDDAEAALRDAQATNDALIRCWLALERAASLAGSGRRLSQTPSEFTASVLQAFDTDPGDTSVVLRLYQRARYGGGRPATAKNAEDLARAQAALGSLRRDIEKHLPRSRAR